MLKELTEIAPVSAVVAVAVWSGISYFVTGPEAATRIAHADYFEECQASLIATVQSNVREQEREVNQPTDVESQASATREYFGQMEQQFPDHVQFLDIITGGGFSQTAEISNRAATRVREARVQARQAIQERADRAISAAPDQCSCQIQAALSESRAEWAMYAATLTLIEQENVENFPALMRANLRSCAERLSS